MLVGGTEDPNQMKRRLREVQGWLPNVGDIWHWEPMKSWASERVKVVEIGWNNHDECYIGTVRGDGTTFGWKEDEIFMNDISRFFEACVLIKAADEPEEPTPSKKDKVTNV
jgi:hypothetical protein